MNNSLPLPTEIRVVPLAGNGIHYILPPRRLGKARWYALFPIGIGLFGLAFMVEWTRGFAGQMQPMLSGLIAVLVAIPGFAFGLAVIGIGLAMLFGRAEFKLQKGRLYSTERLAFLWWTRKCNADQVSKFVVTNAYEIESDGRPLARQPLRNLDGLKAELQNGNFWLTLGYPKTWLLDLAQHLSIKLQECLDKEGLAASPLVPVVDSSSIPVGETDRLEQPVGSRIDFQRVEDGFTFLVPPRGIWKGSGGLFFFSLLWCGFMVVFTTMFVRLELMAKKAQFDRDTIIFTAFATAFWLIGIGLMTYAIHLARRRTAIAVSGNRMMAIQTGLLGTKRQEWDLEELTTARVGPSDMAMNEKPLLQVQLVPKEGKPYGILTAVEEPELEWIATTLRLAIKFAAETSPAEPFVEN